VTAPRLALVLALGLLANAALADSNDARRDVPAGTIERHRLYSTALHSNRSVRVYLPPSYSRGDSAKRYPTVYLLHGWPGGDNDWFARGDAAITADTLIASGRMPEVVMISPNGRAPGFLGRSLYLDSYDGDSRVFTFISQDLVHWVDSTFRTVPDPRMRAVVGLSDGGTAALNLVFQRPDVFRACAGLSGRYDLQPEFALGGVLGPEPGRTRLLDENSPTKLAKDLAPALGEVRIHFDCGVSDGPIDDNRELDRVLTELGIAHEFREYPGGHKWKYWRSHLGEALEYVTAGMR
jgi:enterochelin esterase-like enzyme